MKNFIQAGNTLTLVAPAAVIAGDVVKVGSFIGVAAGAADNGADVETLLVGVFDLPKAAGAITQGAAVYWDATAKKVTTTSSGNTLLGKATKGVASGAATVPVRLDG